MPALSRRYAIFAGSAVGLILVGRAEAHHGWGSYDAAAAFAIDGEILTVKYENPHGEVEIMHAGRRWTCTLAPPFRMQTRGLPPETLRPGVRARVEGYPSRVNDAEMRAERITIAGKTVELR
jgi:hypothetical protein